MKTHIVKGNFESNASGGYPMYMLAKENVIDELTLDMVHVETISEGDIICLANLPQAKGWEVQEVILTRKPKGKHQNPNAMWQQVVCKQLPGNLDTLTGNFEPKEIN